MSNTLVINTLEELKAFLDEKGVMEIATRGLNKKFKAFQRVMINNLPEMQEQELTQKVIHILNRNTRLNERTLNLLGNVARLEKIGIVLNGFNLCATCAGFAIMYKKLDAMSSEINQQLCQLKQTIKHTHDIQADYEFDKVLSEHMDMLDSQRKQQPYSESKMRELVDREYNVLMLLIRTFQKGVSGNHYALIISIFSMLAMFTVSLRSFDEIYYYNNRKALGDKSACHLSHEKWMGIYDTLSSEWFIEKLQDYGMFETKLTTRGVDIYYLSLVDQVNDFREEIEDNQELLIAMGDVELFRQFHELNTKEVVDTIEAAFREAGKGFKKSTVKAAYQDALQQAAIV